MFNKHFNLQDFVADLPPSIRQHVLSSIVGSINSALVYGADQVARVMQDDIRYGDLALSGTPEEVEAVMNSIATAPEFGTFFAEMRSLSALGDVLRTQFLSMQKKTTSDELQFGSLEAAVATACGVQRTRKPSHHALEQLRAVGIEPTKEMIEEAAADQQRVDQQYADHRAARRGLIDWVLLHCFDAFITTGDGDYWDGLPGERKEALVAKLLYALESGISKATRNTMFNSLRENDLGVGDVPLLRDYKAQVITLAYSLTKRDELREAMAPPPAEESKPKAGKRSRAHA